MVWLYFRSNFSFHFKVIFEEYISIPVFSVLQILTVGRENIYSTLLVGFHINQVLELEAWREKARKKRGKLLFEERTGRGETIPIRVADTSMKLCARGALRRLLVSAKSRVY